MRPSPRTVILRALETEPQALRALRSAVVSGALRQDPTLGPVTMTVRAAYAATDRHLCKLLRARRIQRRPDGLYELRSRPARTKGSVTIPAGTLKPGDRIKLSGTISIRRQSPEADTFSFKVVAKEDIGAGAAVVIDAEGLAVAWKG